LLQATSIAVLLIVMGKSVLQLFGSEFELGYRILLVLVVAQLFNCATGPVLQLFIMTGNERTAFAVLLPVVAIAVPGYYAAGTIMGGTGVALVVTTAFAAWNVTLVVLAKMRFGIWLSSESWLGTGALLLGAGALALFLTSGRFSLWGFIYLTATVAGLWAFGLTPEDRRLLRQAAAKAPGQTVGVR
jgi:O-antigen/teichoic acid export membrane protein